MMPKETCAICGSQPHPEVNVLKMTVSVAGAVREMMVCSVCLRRMATMDPVERLALAALIHSLDRKVLEGWDRRLNMQKEQTDGG